MITNSIYAIKIDEPNKKIIIDDLLNFEQTVYYYDEDGCLCPPPQTYWIGSTPDPKEELEWTTPLQQNEIEIYLDEIDFDFIIEKYPCQAYEYFDFFASYLRGEEI